MNERLQHVLARYERRAGEERARREQRGDAVTWEELDTMLLPVGPVTGALLADLVRATRARSVLEVGTSHGYSTLWLADAVRETGGHVISLELAANKVEQARAALDEAGLHTEVTFITGDAIDSLATLPGPFEFVLIDLWKHLYIPVFDALYPKLAPGALIVADNMLEPARHRAGAIAYRAHIRTRPGIESALLPIGEGLEITRFNVPL